MAKSKKTTRKKSAPLFPQRVRPGEVSESHEVEAGRSTAIGGHGEVIESIRWRNKRTGQLASVYGAVPWTRQQDRDDWEKEVVGWTIRWADGTVGIGRQPFATRAEAQDWLDRENERRAAARARLAPSPVNRPVRGRRTREAPAARGRIRGHRSAAPPGPASGFGHERTADDFRARIEWERWAAAEHRRSGHEALAQGHDLARVAYEEELRKLQGGLREAPREREYSMTYGELPPFEQFEEDIRRPDPDHDGHPYWPEYTLYPMELVGAREIELAERYGLDEFEAERQRSGRNTSVRGFQGDERQIYGFLEYLVEQFNDGDEEAGDLASSIMTTLGYEWI